MTHKAASHWSVIIPLSLISALTPFAIDAYLPALPVMAEQLNSTPMMMQTSIASYLLGVAFCPIVSGAVSDAIGRKPVLTASLLLFQVFSILCALVHSAEGLVALRFLQGAAGGTAMIVARVVLADIYRGDALSRAASHLMIFLSMAPVIAPLVGGLLMELGTWHLIFYVLTLLAILPLVSLIRFPETLAPEQRQRLSLSGSLHHYAALIRRHKVRLYLAISSASTFFFFAMLSGSPFIFVDHYGLTPLVFGQLFATISATALVANMINARYVMRLGYFSMLRRAITLVAIAAVTLMIIVLTDFGGVWGVYGVLLGLMAAFHLIGANVNAALIDEVGERIGAVSALMAFCRFASGTLGAVAVGALPFSPPMDFALVLVFSACVMVSAFRVVTRS